MKQFTDYSAASIWTTNLSFIFYSTANIWKNIKPYSTVNIWKNIKPYSTSNIWKNIKPENNVILWLVFTILRKRVLQISTQIPENPARQTC
jgi:hypothetical protein